MMILSSMILSLPVDRFDPGKATDKIIEDKIILRSRFQGPVLSWAAEFQILLASSVSDLAKKSCVSPSFAMPIDFVVKKRQPDNQ